jgi:hypothetical protein
MRVKIVKQECICISGYSVNNYLQLDEVDLSRTPIAPNNQILGDLARAVRRELKMELFGIDVIIDCDTKKYAVIDINAFPGK